MDNSDYGLLDLRFGYQLDMPWNLTADFFLDVFNVLDDQGAIRIQDVEAGADGVEFGEGLNFNDPRRFFLGARLRI